MNRMSSLGRQCSITRQTHAQGGHCAITMLWHNGHYQVYAHNCVEMRYVRRVLYPTHTHTHTKWQLQILPNHLLCSNWWMFTLKSTNEQVTKSN